LDRCTEAVGDDVVVKARYYLHLISYGSTPRIWGNGQMNIEEAVSAYAAANQSMGLGGRLGGTDAAAAMQTALTYLSGAIADEKFRESFPPLVFHLTDGESQTDATAVVDKIKALSTIDGNVLVCNTYIGTRTSLHYTSPEDFPGYVSEADVGSNPDNLRMFHMSSVAPENMRRNLVETDIFPKLRAGSRLFFDVRTKDILKHAIQVVGSIDSRAAR